MRRLALPVPVGPLVVLAVGAGLLVLSHSIALDGWAYADWAAVSAETRQSLTLAGPWIAGCSAWVAGPLGSPSSALCPAGAARRGRGLVGAQLSRLCVVAWLGCAAGLAPALVHAARSATYGGLSVWVVASSVTLICGFVALGYLVGVLLPRVAAAPVAAALAFAPVVLGPAEGSVVVPVYPFDGIAGLAEVATATASRTAFFAVAASTLALLSAWWLRHRFGRVCHHCGQRCGPRPCTPGRDRRGGYAPRAAPRRARAGGHSGLPDRGRGPDLCPPGPCPDASGPQRGRS